MKIKMAREDYEQYKKLLLQLHEMNRQGTDQTDEADVIRDQMDAPGYRLNEKELERVNGLSADLYMISGEEVSLPETPPMTLQDFLSNCLSKNWDRVLEYFRAGPPGVSERVIASSRALCWGALGDYDVALLFADYALKLSPDDKRYQKLVQMYRKQLELNNQSLEENSNPLVQQVGPELFREMGLLQTA